MTTRDFRAIAILPGTALIVIPLIILWLTRGTLLGAAPVTFSSFFFMLALIFAAFGLFLFVWTVGLFRRKGEGTLAPWDPPKEFVALGPYRHARNPMITGVLFIMIAEAVYFNSLGLALWAALFFAINTVYLVVSEERGLEKRFGETYLRYKENVPRWLPRPTPWQGRSSTEVTKIEEPSDDGGDAPE